MEGWEYIVREVCCFPAFIWLAWQDKKYLGISRLGLFVTSVLIVTAGLFAEASWQSRFGGVAVGIVLLVFGLFSNGAMGAADAVIITACGAAFGLYETVGLSFFAALYAGIFSGVLLIAKKVKRKSRIPFLPFVLLGYVTMRILMYTA